FTGSMISVCQWPFLFSLNYCLSGALLINCVFLPRCKCCCQCTHPCCRIQSRFCRIAGFYSYSFFCICFFFFLNFFCLLYVFTVLLRRSLHKLIIAFLCVSKINNSFRISQFCQIICIFCLCKCSFLIFMYSLSFLNLFFG